MKVPALVLAVAVASFGSASAALPDPSPAPTTMPHAMPTIPPGVANSPIVQSVLNSLGGVLQTTNGNTAHGTVTYFKRYDLQVETAPRIYRQIHLHQGTIINPRGTTLTPGMVVDVTGTVNGDGSLNADSIVAR